MQVLKRKKGIEEEWVRHLEAKMVCERLV